MAAAAAVDPGVLYARIIRNLAQVKDRQSFRHDYQDEWLGVDAQGRFYAHEKPNCFLRLICSIVQAIFCCCCSATDEMPRLQQAFVDITRDLNDYLGSLSTIDEFRVMQKTYQPTVDKMLFIAGKLYQRRKVEWDYQHALQGLPNLQEFLNETYRIDLGDSKSSQQVTLTEEGARNEPVINRKDTRVDEVYSKVSGRCIVVKNDREDQVTVKVQMKILDGETPPSEAQQSTEKGVVFLNGTVSANDAVALWLGMGVEAVDIAIKGT